MQTAQTFDQLDEALPLNDMANAIRALSMDAVQKANSGHPGMPMGMADVATILFAKYLKFDPKNPTWANRDRFILSAGHGSMLLYSLLHLTGYEKVTMEEIKNFRQMGSVCAGHPEVDQDAGIEMTTGPLGQGIATSVGFAMAEAMLKARFGGDVIDHKTFVIASDGDLMEGVSHEACSLAGHLGLNNLVVLYDDNGISIDGQTDLSFSDDTLKRFEAYGWKTLRVDGHDMEAIDRALGTAVIEQERPVLIACKTKIGFGAPTKENTAASHGSPLGDDEIKGAKENLGWEYGAFEIPGHVETAWREVANKGAQKQEEWQAKYEALDLDQRTELEQFYNVNLEESVSAVIEAVIKEAIDSPSELATRKASGKVLAELDKALPQLIGGSADLSGSNSTFVQEAVINKSDFSGKYIHYGVREHGMAAIMNGLALHGGFIPYSGTFLTFSDYCRPSIRLAALMKSQAIHVMTHDSIGLGEDGPTHQPVEHMAALRAIPNCYSFRPADLVETAESWQVALTKTDAPSVLALTRQNLKPMRLEKSDENLTAKGGYILKDFVSSHVATIFASGSEVEIAMEAADQVEAEGFGVRVVSVPCYDLLLEQGADYIKGLKGDAKLQIACEAAVRMGWDHIIGSDGLFFGMKSFGESAPYEELYEHYGITASNIVDAIMKQVN